jgi:hypothetical protein
VVSTDWSNNVDLGFHIEESCNSDAEMKRGTRTAGEMEITVYQESLQSLGARLRLKQRPLRMDAVTGTGGEKSYVRLYGC